ncbi:hypothetical protein HQQ94_03850 [Shewanella sp. VB17]|uniref:ADP-ribosyltransferase domain-containing protein n=1 Tax=Shewanella sp. VB17 TaxID=2739432 RepID=UPI0015672C89|nr:ADP-ribosyltransferase domain-containing protein [Shewanella sp. VB17]NRD72390.1 hypothetical protein [Shewanella sp. VB17]
MPKDINKIVMSFYSTNSGAKEINTFSRKRTNGDRQPNFKVTDNQGSACSTVAFLHSDSEYLKANIKTKQILFEKFKSVITSNEKKYPSISTFYRGARSNIHPITYYKQGDYITNKYFTSATKEMRIATEYINGTYMKADDRAKYGCSILYLIQPKKICKINDYEDAFVINADKKFQVMNLERKSHYVIVTLRETSKAGGNLKNML